MGGLIECSTRKTRDYPNNCYKILISSCYKILISSCYKILISSCYKILISSYYLILAANDDKSPGLAAGPGQVHCDHFLRHLYSLKICIKLFLKINYVIIREKEIGKGCRYGTTYN